VNSAITTHQLSRPTSPTTPLPYNRKSTKHRSKHCITLEEWSTTHSIQEEQGNWLKDGALSDSPRRGAPTQKSSRCYTMHLPQASYGRDKTFTQVSQVYWWPGMRTWVTNYIAGCTVCHRTRTSPIAMHAVVLHPTPDNALPFQQIALDLITGLPPNGPHDSVLTIVDHGCS